MRAAVSKRPADPTPASDSPLLQPVQVGPWTLANRVVMAPMTRNRAEGGGRVPSPLAPRYYAQRASAGLIVTEATHAHPSGFGYLDTPGIHTPEQIAAWRRVTDAVHARGGRIVLQIWHTGRIAHPSLLPGNALPVAPSAIAPGGGLYLGSRGMVPFVTPRALTRDELPGIVASFADGARQALAAGFDGVEIHGANGYLLDQFLRDGSNQRTDAYGGSVANRARLLLEATDAAVDAIGADRVGVRVSPFNPYNSMVDSDPAATFTHVARELATRDLAYLHLLDPAPQGARLTDAIRAAFPGTLIVNGGYDRAGAEAVLRAGRADLVAFATAYIANPDLVERFAEGAPLAEGDRATYYAGGARGYADYPMRDGTVLALPGEDVDGAAGDSTITASSAARAA
jgi:N-ethylmaleimide reductase